MIPPYQPRLALWNLLKARTALRFGRPADRLGLLDALGLPDHWGILGYRSGRAALSAWFREYTQKTNRPANGENTVLMSVFSYPAAVRLLEPFEFVPHFVDVEPNLPFPDSRSLLDTAASLHAQDKLAGVLLSPVQGYAPLDWIELARTLAERYPDVPLLFDMGQGAGLSDALGPALAEASGIAFSFNLGKLTDTGGGALAYRHFDIRQRNISPLRLDAVANAIGMRVLNSLATRSIAQYISTALIEERSVQPYTRNYLGDAVDPRAYLTWTWAMRDVRAEIELARERAAQLFAQPKVIEACQRIDFYAQPHQAHLRLLLCLESSSRRDAVIEQLAQAGIASSAPPIAFPSSYLPDPPADEDFPNAKAFLATTLQLPFPGRLNDKQFDLLHDEFVRALG